MTIHCGDYRRAKRDEDTLWNLSFRRVKRGEIYKETPENQDFNCVSTF